MLGVISKICTFGNCQREFIKTGLFAAVIIGETIGFPPWDAKVVQKWVEKLVVECEKQATKNTVESIEDGIETGREIQSSKQVVHSDDVKPGLHEKPTLVEAIQA